MLRGAPDAGVGRAIDRSLRLSRDANERGHEAWARRLLGEITSRRDPAEVVLAEGCYRHALALADELGMRPLAAHCHLGLSTLYRRTSDGERAREHLTTATTMYREMHMPFWLEQAKAMMSGEP